MKRIGLLALAIVLSMGLLGVGFAQWTETLNISGTADTGDLDVTFCDGWNIDGSLIGRGLISNDDGVSNEAYWINNSPKVPDPDDTGGDPTACQDQGQFVNRIANVASTTVVGDGTQTATITMSKAYPGYHSTVFFAIRNWGTIPAKVQSVKLIAVSKKGVVIDIPDVLLVPCETWYVHFVQDPVTGEPIEALVDDEPFCAHLSLHLSNPPQWHPLGLLGTMEAGGHGNYSEVNGDICIDIGDHAEELTLYDLVIEIVVVPFNM